jgi:hypothetical protein
MNKILVIVAIVVGILLIVVSVAYFMTPARYLPSFFPGYDRSLMVHHYKHGIGSFILGVACFVFAWFQSGKKKSVKEEKQAE